MKESMHCWDFKVDVPRVARLIDDTSLQVLCFFFPDLPIWVDCQQRLEYVYLCAAIYYPEREQK